MLESTLRDRATALLTPSARSDVPPFMVMDVMAAAARIEAAGGHVIHMEVGQPAASAPKVAIAAAHAALDAARIDYTSALGIPSLRARIARHYRDTYGCAVDPERIVITTGSSGGFILAFLSMFEPGDRVAVDGAGLSAISAYPDGARLRAGADRDIERDASCADGRGLAGRASQDAAEGRAGRQPRQSDGNDDVARGAHRPDQCGGRRRHPLHFRRDLSRPRLCVSGGDGRGAFAACARDQFVLEIFLHDRLAGRLDGGAGAAGAADRTAAAEPVDLGADAVADRGRSGLRRPRQRWRRSSAAIRRTAAS